MGRITPEEGAAVIARLAAEPWPGNADEARDRMGREGMSLGPGSSYPGGVTGPVVGAPSEWEATWFESESGFALTLFVAETTPLDTTIVHETADAYVSALDGLMPRLPLGAAEPSRRGIAWFSGGAVVELDRIDSHDRIGLVQVHLESPAL